MRALFLAALLIVSPALADDWQRYENTTYGYSIDIPPGLLWRGESYERDGQDFTTPTLTLSLKGKHMPDGFEAAIRDWREWETQMGWTLTYEMTTPGAASASGKRPNWLLEMRAVPLCNDALAIMQLEYGVGDAANMKPVIARLASSFKATRRC
jgi:hypothetical protein